VWHLCIEGFKEKWAVVLEELRKALDNITKILYTINDESSE